MKKIMLVFGTRPEAIKMAPLYHSLKDNSGLFETYVCVTAQHREMLDQVLKVFDIKVDMDLNLMTHGQDLFDVTSSVLLGIRKPLKFFSPDIMMLHGDTSTTLASAMAGFYAGIPIGHIEAGLRSHNIYSPFPEEFNRVVTSKISKFHFAPTELSKKNLLVEGVPEQKIHVTGNTVIDSLQWVISRIEKNPELYSEISNILDETLSFSWKSERYILVTAHRRENFGERFIQICESIKRLAKIHTAIHFVYPVHENPNVKVPAFEILKDSPNIHLIKPLEYESFIYLLKHCFFVLTDSGGIQEEGPSLGKPVLVLRDVTERPEGVESGSIRVVGASMESIVENVSDLINNEQVYLKMSTSSNPFGDGQACSKIIDILRVEL